MSVVPPPRPRSLLRSHLLTWRRYFSRSVASSCLPCFTILSISWIRTIRRWYGGRLPPAPLPNFSLDRTTRDAKKFPRSREGKIRRRLAERGPWGLLLLLLLPLPAEPGSEQPLVCLAPILEQSPLFLPLSPSLPPGLQEDILGSCPEREANPSSRSAERTERTASPSISCQPGGWMDALSGASRGASCLPARLLSSFHPFAQEPPERPPASLGRNFGETVAHPDRAQNGRRRSRYARAGRGQSHPAVPSRQRRTSQAASLLLLLLLPRYDSPGAATGLGQSQPLPGWSRLCLPACLPACARPSFWLSSSLRLPKGAKMHNPRLLFWPGARDERLSEHVQSARPLWRERSRKTSPGGRRGRERERLSGSRLRFRRQRAGGRIPSALWLRAARRLSESTV